MHKYHEKLDGLLAAYHCLDSMMYKIGVLDEPHKDTYKYCKDAT